MSDPSGLGPLPSADRWQELVRAALRETDETKPRLRWTSRGDASRWDLNGDCPRCGDHTSKLVGGVVANDSGFEAGTLVEVLMACDCDVVHTANQRGCGAGRGAYITVPGPVE